MPDPLAQFDTVERRTVELLQRTDEDRAMALLDAEYRKEQMHNMAARGFKAASGTGATKRRSGRSSRR